MKPSATCSRRAAVADLLAQRGEALAHRFGIERRILLRPEDFRKEIRNELADHDVGVGDRERAAAPVACRSGIGAGGIRADAKPRAVEMQDRSAAGGDGVDQHHRRAHAHAGNFGLERALVFAGEMRHVGRGAAHVEADELRENPPRGRSPPCRRRRPPARTGSRPCRETVRAAVNPPDDIMNIRRGCAVSAGAPPLAGVELVRHLRRRSGAGSARDTRQPRWYRRGRPA